ncbi:MAG: LysM peptidoglycan-binding domain-containing protein [Flavobacteriales bacterium]|nr:LysM peptidoglycan-binding domain-containing protein [Flavobacteriales bacterium]
MKAVGLFVFGLTFSLSLNATSNLSKKEYVSVYEKIAIQQMTQYKIPASITIAQGILESGSGNSTLAKTANNHFGIKCHTDWKGEKVYLDDDAKNECFRSYPKVEDSYIDHSMFLSTRKRYESLFTLTITDYKGWAYGLKSAGYATNPKYAEELIKLIEELELYKLDGTATTPISSSNSELILTKKKHENNVDYIVVKKGDSFYQIAKRYGLTLSQLHAYNDFNPEKDILEEDDIVYLEPKRFYSRAKNTIVLERSMSLREISQKEAVKLKKLMRKNQVSSPDEQLPKGEKIFLR